MPRDSLEAISITTRPENNRLRVAHRAWFEGCVVPPSPKHGTTYIPQVSFAVAGQRMAGIVAAMPEGQFAWCTVVFNIPTLLIDLLVALLTGSGRSTDRAGNFVRVYSVGGQQAYFWQNYCCSV
jgi:hypothetical protein